MAFGAETSQYELRGRLVPATQASVWLNGATSPFEDSALAGDDGQFRFRGLTPGAYTLGIFVPGRGEMRRTIEVGPSQADSKRRVELKVALDDGAFESQDTMRRQAMVSVKDLAIPDGARHEYEAAEQRLARRDVDGALAHLQRAVELAPQFPDAWNHLGTIAYQARNYTRAESCFRKALEADPKSFQPLVNLGGVTINLGKFEESLQYNLYAALTRPNDALANSQLGMSYFYLGKLEQAQKYLREAKRLDPAHFSHPQLLLAEIALRRQDKATAVAELAEFLQYHPDAPEAARVKEKAAQLRAASDPGQSFAATGMARTFSASPQLELFEGARYSVTSQDGQYYLRIPNADGRTQQTAIDATIGSGRHLRILLSRGADGYAELPVAWSSEKGGHYASAPGFGFSFTCLACHARAKDDHAAGFGCTTCHAQTGSEKPTQSVCLQCHPAAGSANSTHGARARPASSEEAFEFNSAGYRLLASRCYQASAGRLTCTTCHPPHGFSKTAAEYRMVCRGCHPTMHESQELDCTHCHMPKRPADDAAGIPVTDHRIQRPL